MEQSFVIATLQPDREAYIAKFQELGEYDPEVELLDDKTVREHREALLAGKALSYA